MRPEFIAVAAAIVLATATTGFAGDNAPYAGTWDCEVSTFSGEGPMPIQKVEKEEGNYILSFPTDTRSACRA